MKDDKAEEEKIWNGERYMKIQRCLRWRRRWDGAKTRKKKGIKIRRLSSV